MATGPEHYDEAERLIERGPDNYENPSDCWAKAQVHATLALAAAIGVGMPVVMGGEECMPHTDSDAWLKAASSFAADQATAPATDVDVTIEPGVGAVVEADGIRYFHQPTRLGDGNPWASATAVDSRHWHAWPHVTKRGPVRLLLDAPGEGA